MSCELVIGHLNNFDWIFFDLDIEGQINIYSDGNGKSFENIWIFLRQKILYQLKVFRRTPHLVFFSDKTFFFRKRSIPIWEGILTKLLMINIWIGMTNGTACFLVHFHLLQRVPLKRCRNFFMPLEPISNKSFCFNEQNVYYEHCRKV